MENKTEKVIRKKSDTHYFGISNKILLIVLLIIFFFTIGLSVSVSITSFNKFTDITMDELSRMSAIFAKRVEELEKNSLNLVKSYNENKRFLEQMTQLANKGPYYALDKSMIDKNIEESEQIYFLQAQLKLINMLKPVLGLNKLSSIELYITSPFNMVNDAKVIPVLRINEKNILINQFNKKGLIENSRCYKIRTKDYKAPSQDYFDISSVYSLTPEKFFKELGFIESNKHEMTNSSIAKQFSDSINSIVKIENKVPLIKTWHPLTTKIANPESFEKELALVGYIVVKQELSPKIIKKFSDELGIKLKIIHDNRMVIPAEESVHHDKKSVTINNEEYFFAAERISLINSSNLTAVALSPISILDELTQSLSYQIALTGVIVMILAGILIYFIIQQQIKLPLKKLMNGVTQISDGKYETHVKINSKDEFGKLSSAFNDMTSILNKKTEALYQSVSQLKNAQNYISSIINSMPSILIGVDADGQVTQWNKKAEESTGIKTIDANGKYLGIIYPKMALEMAEIEESIKTHKIKTETRKPYKDGKDIFYQDITIYPLIANGAKGAVIIIDDVTRQFELEQQLNQSRKLDAIGQLAGGIAHDFNNMLSGIMGAAELLKYNKVLDEKNIKFLNIIIKSSTKAADLTAKLLAFGHKSKATTIAVDIHSIIDDTMELLERSIDKKITINFIKNTEKSTVVGNNSLLQNSFMNIAINASHAMPDGGDITFTTSNVYLDATYCNENIFNITPGNYLLVDIRDSGCGIPLEHLKKIFDPFFTTKEQGKGTGLGLAAVYGIIQDHHGAITVYSEVNVGTVFHIYLPLSDQSITIKQNLETVISGTGLVLFVDDEEIIRVTVEEMLKELNYNVIIAKNGLEAVEIFKKKYQKIDLVLLDMIMPEMNGREAFFKMREIKEDVKVIISSGFSKDGDLDELNQNGLKAFIHKPYRISELSQVLAKTLNN